MATALHQGQDQQIQNSPVVVGLVPHRADQARLAGALRGFARFRPVGTLDECRAVLQEELPAIVGVIVEPQDVAGVSTSSFIAEMSASLPMVPIVGYCDMKTRGDAVALARAGVHDIVIRGVDDGHLSLRDSLLTAAHSTAINRVTNALRPLVDSSVLRLIQHCLTVGRHPITVVDAAAALGVHRKTLVNQCARAKLPPPTMIIGWSRLFLAVALLERRSYTVERIANELEFASSTALRNTIRRYVGVTASDVRARGGLQFVLDAFVSRIGGTPHSASSRGQHLRLHPGTFSEERDSASAVV